MKVYRPHAVGKIQTLLISPGVDHPETSEWFTVVRDKEGKEIKTARMFSVKFEHGEAQVEDNIGLYLVNTKQAQKSNLILPDRAA